jgi:uncharacterized protein (DUF305 family)
MKTISIYLAISFMIIAGIIGVGIGYALTPEYSLAMYDKNKMDLGQPDRWLDLRYINAMIAHHRGAVLLAEQATRESHRPDIKSLATEIPKGEQILIDELYKWKKAWYGDGRVVRDPVSPKLGSYDEKFDLRFLNALIAHHEAGVLMTKETRLKSSRTEILNNADAVEEFLINSAKMLKEWRQNWYNISTTSQQADEV